MALDLFFGEGHHLVIDVSFSSVWKNTTIRGCSTVPGFAAAQCEQAKFDTLMLLGRLASLYRGCMMVPTPLSLSWVRMAVGPGGEVGLAARARPGYCNWLAGLLLVGVFGRRRPAGTPPVAVPLLP